LVKFRRLQIFSCPRRIPQQFDGQALITENNDLESNIYKENGNGRQDNP
jgi:hypothetical protein